MLYTKRCQDEFREGKIFYNKLLLIMYETVNSICKGIR